MLWNNYNFRPTICPTLKFGAGYFPIYICYQG